MDVSMDIHCDSVSCIMVVGDVIQILIISQSLHIAFAQQCLRNLVEVDTVSFPTTPQLRYFELRDSGPAYQVIIPQLQFTCHGVITSYSALTVLFNEQGFLNNLRHHITFGVWRPRQDGSGVYDLVGTNTLLFNPTEITARYDIDNSTGSLRDNLVYFNFTDKEPEQSELIFFRPDDILGWFDHSTFGNQKPLILVYREPATIAENLQALNLVTIPLSGVNVIKECSLSLCDSQVQQITSVIPYFTVKYNITSASSSDISCDGTIPTDLEACVVTAPTTSPLSTTSAIDTATSTADVDRGAQGSKAECVTPAGISTSIFMTVTVYYSMMHYP